MCEKIKFQFRQLFGHFFLNTVQRKIVTECINDNSDEFSKWHFNNVWYPLFILIGTAIFVFFYNSFDIGRAVDVLLNGSLTILGISIVFSMSSYLILRNSSNEDEIDTEVVKLSDKLSGWGNLVIFFAGILYVIQIIALPPQIGYKLLILLVVLIVLYACITIGLKSFIIRDDFYTNSIKKKFKKADQTANTVDDFMLKLEEDEE